MHSLGNKRNHRERIGHENIVVSGSAFSGLLEFSDDAGNVLANMEKKTTCRNSLATVSSALTLNIY